MELGSQSAGASPVRAARVTTQDKPGAMAQKESKGAPKWRRKLTVVKKPDWPVSDYRVSP